LRIAIEITAATIVGFGTISLLSWLLSM